MKKSLTFLGALASIEDIMSFVLDAGIQVGIPAKKYYCLRLAVEEFIVNSIKHGYLANNIEDELEIHVRLANGYFTVSIIDSAPAFNPKKQAKPDDLDASAEERDIGGLGIYIALQQVDIYRYQYRNGKNINTLSFECPTEAITQLMMSQMTAVNRLSEDLAKSIDDLSEMATKMRNKLDASYDLLAENHIEVPSYQNVGINLSLKKVRSNAERVTAQMNQFQEFLRISSSIYSALELDLVLDTVMIQVLSLTGANRALLFLREQGSNNLRIEAARTEDGQRLSLDHAPYSSNIVERVFTMKQPIMSIDAQKSEEFQAFPSVFSQSVRAVMCIPLMLHGESVGVLYADNNLEAGNLDQDLIPLLTIFANQVAVAIENARSIEKQRHEARLEHEIKIAEEIQSDFLPPSIPSIQGWIAEPYFQPAREVAGDFYDAFLLNETSLAFVVGDVCDKGLGSALFMALIRSLLRAYAEQQHLVIDNSNHDQHLVEISTTIQNIVLNTNNYISVNHGRTNMFATVFFGVIEPNSNTLVYINAGHNPPFIMDSNGIVKQAIKTSGPAVGMFPDMKFGVASVEIEPGDFIICYTDGLTEAKNIDGNFFSEDRLIALFHNQPPSSAKDAVARIRTSVKAHIADAPQFDDITLLVIQQSSNEDEK